MTMIISDDAYDKRAPCVLFENVLDYGAVSASTADAGYDVENATSGTTWDAYKPVSATSANYDVDAGVDVECDCAFVDAHTLGSVGGSVRVWASTDGVGWTPITDAVDVADNGAVMLIWRGVEYRYWRIAFTHDAAPEIGVLSIGKRLVFPNGIATPHTSIQHSKKIEVLGGDSDSGQFTGQMIVRKSASVNVTFPLLDADWVENEMKPFETHYNEAKPFAWAASPLFDGDDMGYCQRPSGAGELSPSYYEGGMYEEFTMRLGVYVNV